jgi:Peptidase A4 family
MRTALQGFLALVLIVSIGYAVVDRLNGDIGLTPGSAQPATAPASPLQAPVRVVAAADDASTAAIQQVIQHSNDEQVQAIAAKDSSLMQDTVTSDHYQELVRVNQDLLDNNVSSISLVRLDWGDIAVNGTTATAITYETWRTTYADGTTEQSRDQNNYTLVQDSGAWKISADDHPGNAPGAQAPAPQRPVPSVPGVPDDRNSSHNWSGYAATGGHYTAVSGTWTVPQFSPDGSFGIDAAWVGIGGVRSRDLIQAGTEQTVSGSGSTQYEAWVEMLPRSSRSVALSVHPGDSVTVSISEQSANTWLIQFTNNTTGQTYQETQQYTSSHSSAEWVEEAPSAGRGGVLPLSNFGSIDFSNGSAVKDGQSVTIGSAGASPITMLGANDQPLAVPSPLGNDGSSFTVARTDAPATAAGRGSFQRFPGRRRGG